MVLNSGTETSKTVIR